MVIANELEVGIKTTSGPAIERPGDLVALFNDTWQTVNLIDK